MNQQSSILPAFTAGFLSFLAPCILPLIPTYSSWLLGLSGSEVIKNKTQNTGIRFRMFVHSLLLMTGFSIVFIALGASASWIGKVLAPHRLLVQRIGGIIIILFGLEVAGFLKVFKNQSFKIVKKLFSKINHHTSSFLVGLVFAFAWVACFSPILGSILILSSFQENLNQGIILLSFYSLGLAIPFLLSSLFLGFLIERIRTWSKVVKLINFSSGLILVTLGVLLFTDKFYKIVIWLSKTL